MISSGKINECEKFIFNLLEDRFSHTQIPFSNKIIDMDIFWDIIEDKFHSYFSGLDGYEADNPDLLELYSKFMNNFSSRFTHQFYHKYKSQNNQDIIS